MHKLFHGTIRPKIQPLGIDPKSGFFAISIEWVDMQSNGVVWKETVKIPPGNAAFSQIECVGTCQPREGIFVDQQGKRHYVLRAEPGKMGAPFG